MRQTLFLLAPPDNPDPDATTTSSAGNGLTRVEVDLAGVLPILPLVEQDPVLRANSTRVVLGAQRFRFPPGARINLFNLVGDADSSSRMLRNIQALETRIKPVRSFNRPINVFKTSRARLPHTLADVPGCFVPHVQSSDPASFEQLEATCLAFGHWPFILRARGQHGGENMVLVREKADLASIREEGWPYRGIHLIEFMDFKGADGLYQKNRVIMVNGTPYPRHAIVSDRWAIHAGSRTDLMDGEKTLREREESFLRNFSERAFTQKYGRTLERIHQRIGLDVFGMDFALLDDQIVVFEANACMNFLRHVRDHQDYVYLNSHVNLLRQAVKRMLVRA